MPPKASTASKKNHYKDTSKELRDLTMRSSTTRVVSNPWRAHLIAFKSSHPSLTLRESMVGASKTYRGRAKSRAPAANEQRRRSSRSASGRSLNGVQELNAFTVHLKQSDAFTKLLQEGFIDAGSAKDIAAQLRLTYKTIDAFKKKNVTRQMILEAYTACCNTDGFYEYE